MVNFALPDYKPTHTLTDFEFLHDPKDTGKKLGIGSFATVKLAREKKSGKLYALKLIDVDPRKASKADIQNLKTEIQIHKALDHPNIVKFHGYIQQGDLVYLILDYAENGNLYTYLHRKKVLTEKEVFRFFYQTCLAINYLHENDIIHRDIKPENLLLDKDFNIKVCDFGWSAYHIKQERSTFCGTYEYMAPELVNKKNYDFRIDIWALGVLLYELIHNKAPYKGRSMQEIKNSMAKGQIIFSEDIQLDAKKLIQKILKVHPSNRILITQILDDSWVGYHLDREEVVRKTVYQEDLKQENYASGHKLKIFDHITDPKLKSLHVITDPFQSIYDGGMSARKEMGVSQSATSLNHISDLSSRNHLQDKNFNIVPHSANNINYHSSKTMTLFDDVTSPLSPGLISLKSPENQRTPKNNAKKKKIFDSNVLSPAFNNRLNRIFDNIGTKPSLPQLTKHVSLDAPQSCRVLNTNLVHQASLNTSNGHSDYFFLKKTNENSNGSSVTTSVPSNPEDEGNKYKGPQGDKDSKISSLKNGSNFDKKALNIENESKTTREGENMKDKYVPISHRDRMQDQGITRIKIFGDELSPEISDLRTNRKAPFRSIEDFTLIKNLWSASTSTTPYNKENVKQAVSSRRNF